MTKERIDWIAISDKLHRIPKDCRTEWLCLKNSKLKKGPFTATEEALIKQRLVEWGNMGSGLWATLQKEMARSSVNISNQWRNVLKSNKASN